MVYELFVSTWNKQRNAQSARPPAPSYSMFVATWTRNFYHVTLRRYRKLQATVALQQLEEVQGARQGPLHPSTPAICQTRERPKVNVESHIV